MTETQHAPIEPSRWFPWTVRLAWIGVYLSCMGMTGWDFMGPVTRAKAAGAGWLSWTLFGAPGDAIVNLHGAAVPDTMRQGDWYRLFLDPWTLPSLLALVFTIWLWSSIGGMFYRIAGAARSWIVLTLGGVAAAGAHVIMNPTAQVGGAGSGGTIYAALGALGVFAFTSSGPIAAGVRRMVIRYLLMFAILSVAFSLAFHGDAFTLGLFAWPAMVAGLIAGALCGLSFGASTLLTEGAGVMTKAVALLALVVVLLAAGQQVPKILEGPERIERVQDFHERVLAVEQAAWRVKDARRATPRQRREVATAIAHVRTLEWLKTWEGYFALEAWLGCFEPYATGDVPDPDAHIRIVIKNAWAGYHPHERALLREVGIAPRKGTRWVARH